MLVGFRPGMSKVVDIDSQAGEGGILGTIEGVAKCTYHHHHHHLSWFRRF